ncbi:MAG: hypothetical protein HY824_08945 [Acidobacteria bacterium]|nr:hypothetical protein [Acidobacteriota bacterium]
MRMASTFRYGVIAAAVLTVGGCRQGDGPVPTPSVEREQELVDVAHDLQNVALGRDPQAAADLADDLRKYTDGKPKAEPAVDELSRRTVQTLAGVSLPGPAAQQLAHHYYMAMMAREMSDRQVETLQNDTQSLLMSIGVAEPTAQQVAQQVGAVQTLVTDRQRRWYELF